MKNLLSSIEEHPLAAFAIVAGVLSIMRLVLLLFSDLNLGPDETQYWFWSLTPDAGYYSKPPMIAWVIALTTNLFGSAEWAVRLSSPLFHLGTACFLFALGSHLYGRAVGFWTGTGWLLMPGIAFSSSLITTDVPLLFYWSGALYLFARIMVETKPGFDEPSLSLAALFGTFVGCGFLSKYAMIYFIIAMAVTLILTGEWRRKRVWQTLSMALVLAMVFLIPNILWNVQHDFQTLSHTASNANWSSDMAHPAELGDFLLGQVAIAGPIIIGAFIVSLIKPITALEIRKNVDNQKRVMLLLAFAVTPIVIVSIQAFLSRAHANWAATAYPALLTLATLWLWRNRHQIWLVASHGFGLVISAVLAVGLSNFALVDQAGLSNAIKRVRGWDIQGPVVADIAQKYPVVMSDDRELTGQLLYYAGLGERGVLAFNSNNRVDNHYEAFFPYEANQADPLLYVTQNPDAIAVTPLFQTVTPLAQTSYDLKRGRTRTLYMFEISGFKGR